MLRDICNHKPLAVSLALMPAPSTSLPAKLRAHAQVLRAPENGGRLGEVTSKPARHAALSRFTGLLRAIPCARPFASTRELLSRWNTEVYWLVVEVALALGITIEEKVQK